MEQFSKILSQCRQLYAGLTAKQRWMLLGGAVVTVAVLLGLSAAAAAPDYKPLVNGMEPADTQKLGAQLAGKNIPYKISADGKSISVPADKLDSTRLEIASSGMPNSGRLGFEIFDRTSWGQTEFDERVNYQRALEGELERTISSLKDVESARVHLVLPNDSMFIDRERSAKASVILKLRSANLPEQTQLAISRLVAGAVEELSPENVTVIDGETNRPLGSAHSGSPFGEDAEKQLTAKLLANLGPVIGADKMRATVGVEYDPSTSEENSEKYDPQSVVAVATQRSEEKIGGDGLSGVPGTASNVPAPAKDAAVSQDGDTDNTQSSKTENSTYAVNKLVRRTMQPAGRIRRITAAVVLDDVTETVRENGKSVQRTRKRTPEELKQIEELAKASIGIDASRGDALTIQNISFSQSAGDGPAAVGKVEKAGRMLRDNTWIIRYLSIAAMFLLAYWFVLKPVKKQVIAVLQPKALAKHQSVALLPEPEAGLDDAVPAQDHLLAMALKKHVIERAKNEPAAASRLVQSWLREDAQ